MSLLTRLQTGWRGLEVRHKGAILMAAGLALVFLGWRVCLSPALNVLRTAESEHRLLDSQLRQMQGLQNQARLLQVRPKISREQAALALDSLTKSQLGSSSQFRVADGQVTISFRNVPAEALGQWLVQARTRADALPAEAHLARSVPPASAPITTPAGSSIPASARWDGTLILILRERP